MDSASALALICRTGTGRLKHIQIKQFFLQNLLRTGVFSVFKVQRKLSPGDLNTNDLEENGENFLEDYWDSSVQLTQQETMTTQ